MPESKSRHPHKHSHQHTEASNIHPKYKKIGKVAIVFALFFGLLGLGLSYYIDASSTTGLFIGAIVGVLAGLIFGYQIDKSLSKKH